MAICEQGIQKICEVPNLVLKILNTEVNTWDYVNDGYKFDVVFGKHKCKSYFVNNVKNGIKFPEQIIPVIEWLEFIAGSNTKVIRCFLNAMEPNQSFKLHVDTRKLHTLSRRLHIPIIMGEGCDYYTYRLNSSGTWDEHIFQMDYGNLYELDNINPHNVKNKNAYRINLIADVIPQDKITNDLTSTDIAQSHILTNIFRFGLPISTKSELAL